MSQDARIDTAANPADGADRLDDNLQWAWAWHRYRYVYRAAQGLRILDAGCGDGTTTRALARLNPGSAVLGIAADVVEREEPGVRFFPHDPSIRLPGGTGPFDFIVCDGLLDRVDDPAATLASLAAVLDDRGLLLVTVAAPAARQAARQVRRAVDAIAPPGADEAERVRIGLELFAALRPDHPARRFFALGGAMTAERLAAEVLPEPRQEWELERLVAAIERAGLAFLYAAAGQPWQPGRIFGADVPETFKARVESLPESARSTLIDALDPSMHMDRYRIYSCPRGNEPIIPAWPAELATDAKVLDRLVPHRSGLAAPFEGAPPAATAGDSVPYRAVNGTIGPIDARSDGRLRLIDGVRTVGAIDALVSGPPEAPANRPARWLDLANRGFIFLESPDPREHTPCVHLGPVRDRLDCPCPRQWVRACDRHGFCSIGQAETHREAQDQARTRLGAERIVACNHCPDYQPELSSSAAP